MRAYLSRASKPSTKPAVPCALGEDRLHALLLAERILSVDQLDFYPWISRRELGVHAQWFGQGCAHRLKSTARCRGSSMGDGPRC